MVQMLTKFSTPTKLDFAEYGSIVKVVTDDGTDLYIQTCRDEEKPHWISVGKFFEKALSDHLVNAKFLGICLELYDNNQKSHLADILNIMIRHE